LRGKGSAEGGINSEGKGKGARGNLDLYPFPPTTKH